jgi:hypothetical protein
MVTEDNTDYFSNLGILSFSVSLSRLTGLGMLCTAYKLTLFMYMNTNYLLNRNMIKLNYSLDATHVQLILNSPFED